MGKTDAILEPSGLIRVSAPSWLDFSPIVMLP